VQASLASQSRGDSSQLWFASITNKLVFSLALGAGGIWQWLPWCGKLGWAIPPGINPTADEAK